MKKRTLVCALMLVAGLVAPAMAQTVDEAQQAAVEKYPDLTRAGTPIHTKFLQLFHEVQETDPSLLSNPEWPLILADQAYALVAADSPHAAPSASSASTPSPAASAPATPPPPRAAQAPTAPAAGAGTQAEPSAGPAVRAGSSGMRSGLQLLFEAFTALGTVAVAIIAIWQDQIIAFFNPVGGEIRRSNLEGKEEGTPQMTFHTYHVRAVATRKNRPLKGCMIVFRQVNRIREGVVNGSIYPVWRQLLWAPAERMEAKINIPIEQEADLGRYYLQKDHFEILFYRQSGEFDPFVFRGQSAKIFLHLRAENVLTDIASIVTVDMTGPAGTNPIVSIE
jgi:hypothetical protein